MATTEQVVTDATETSVDETMSQADQASQNPTSNPAADSTSKSTEGSRSKSKSPNKKLGKSQKTFKRQTTTTAELFRCEGCFAIQIPEDGKQPPEWQSAHFCSKRCESKYSIKQLKRVGIGQRFIHCNFDNYQVSAENEPAFMACAQGVENLERGLFIHGSVGAGKTHLMTAMIHSMIEENIATPDEILFVPILELLERVKSSWERGERSPIEKLKKIPVLFIDDLGMEVVKDWAFQIFLNIVTHRYNEDLPLFISSNLNERELLDRYGTAVLSRLAQMCEIVKLDAPNFRMEPHAHIQNNHHSIMSSGEAT